MLNLKLTVAIASLGIAFATAAVLRAEAGGLPLPPPGYPVFGYAPPPHPIFYPRIPVSAKPTYGFHPYPPMRSAWPGPAESPQLAAAASGTAAYSSDSPDASAGSPTMPPGVSEQDKAEAKEIVRQFSDRLKGALEAAIKDGGAAHAVGVCSLEAPRIAEELSEQTGWDVARTSLKYRNPGNAPDEWERQMLAQFDERRAAGEDAKAIAHAEIIDTEGQDRLRFLKAIPTAGVCLACHGDVVAEDVAEAIADTYPSDLARGYKIGDIRGAFSLSKPVRQAADGLAGR